MFTTHSSDKHWKYKNKIRHLLPSRSSESTGVDKIANKWWITEKAREFQKTPTSASLDYVKAFGSQHTAEYY